MREIKEAPQKVKEWEVANDIIGYQWTDTFVTSKEGEKIRTASDRTYGITSKRKLIKVPNFDEKKTVKK